MKEILVILVFFDRILEAVLCVQHFVVLVQCYLL